MVREDLLSFEDYLEICKLSVQRCGLALGYVKYDLFSNSDRLENWVQMCKFAVNKNPFSINFFNFDKIIKSNPEFRSCMINLFVEALKNKGIALQFIRRWQFSYDEYYQFCEIAVKTDGYAICYVDTDIPKKDCAILCKLASEDPRQIRSLKVSTYEDDQEKIDSSRISSYLRSSRTRRDKSTSIITDNNFTV